MSEDTRNEKSVQSKHKEASIAQSSETDGCQNESSFQEHSFLLDQSNVEEMEEGLLKLLNNFKKGKLNAFDENGGLDKMKQIKVMQEKLAQLHFDLENEEVKKTVLSEEERTKLSQEKMDKLMKSMEVLCSSVQSLHQSPDTD